MTRNAEGHTLRSELFIDYRRLEAGTNVRNFLLTGVLAAGSFTSSLNVLLLSPLLKPIADDFGVADARVGQLATLHAIIGAVVALLVAPLMDRYSRRLVLQIEAVILIAGTLISILAPDFTWLLIGRAVSGLAGGVILATCLAAVGDLFTDTFTRNQRLGVISSAASLAAIIGIPVLTQIESFFNWRVSLAAVLLPLIVILAGSWLFPVLPPTQSASSKGRGSYLAGYRNVLAHQETSWLLVLFTMIGLVIGGGLIYLGAFATERFTASANTLSLMFLISGLTHVSSANLAPLILRRVPARRAFIGYATLLAANFILVGLLFTQTWGMYPFAAITTFCGAGLFLTTRVMLMDSLPSARGVVMSLQAAGNELGWAIGAGIGGLALVLFDNYESVYRTYGLLVPIALLVLALSARAAQAEESEPELAPAASKR